MLNDEKDRLHQIRNLEKIRNTIFNDYKSKSVIITSLEKISDVEKVYLRGPRINSKFRQKSISSNAPGLQTTKNRNIKTACFNTRSKVNNQKKYSPNRNLLEAYQFEGKSEANHSIQIDDINSQFSKL